MNTLRRRLLLAFGGLALAPILVVSCVAAFGAFRVAGRQAARDLGSRLDTLVEIVAGEIEAELYFLDRLAAEWSINPQHEPLVEWLRKRDVVRARLSLPTSIASRILVLAPGPGNAHMIERAGGGFGPPMLLADIPPAALPELYRELLAQPERDAAHRREVRTDFRAAGPQLVLVRTIPSAGGEPFPLLVEEVSLQGFLDQVLERPPFRDLLRVWASTVPRAAVGFSYLYHSDPRLIAQPVDPTDAFVREAAVVGNGPDGSNRSWWTAGRTVAPAAPDWRFRRSGRVLHAVGAIPGSRWLLGASLSMAPLLDAQRSTLIVAALLLGGVSVLVVAGIFHVTRGIGGAVEEIASATAAIAKGDFGRGVRVERSDEFAQIARRLNEMAEELRVTAESRAIARVRASLVHDIKGVSSQMKLLLHNLRNNIDDAEFRAECFELMQGMIDHIESLGSRLRGDDERRRTEPAEVDLDALVASILDGPILGTRPGIRLRRDLRAGASVATDREALKLALVNVLTNAAEAMSGDGEMRVATGRLEPGTAAGERTHFVEVEDNGPGMSPEFVQRELFRPFATTKARGTGLGMYEARRAIARCAGTIAVRSEQGRGTTVRIEVGPLAPRRGET